jgi:hypothetical protein
VAGIVRTASKRNHIARPKEILPRIDGRSVIARRYRDLYLQIVADQGGPERVSEVREQLIRRYAAASVLAEMLEAELANGKQIDLGQHALLTSSLVRLSSRIGIDRKAKNVTPALKDYIDSKAKRTGHTIDHDNEDA